MTSPQPEIQRYKVTMDNSQDECWESCRRAQSRSVPTTTKFLDNFDKGCDVLKLERDRKPIVLNAEGKSRSCGSNAGKPKRCTVPPSAKSVRTQHKRTHEGPFDPNKEFRHLAYQPIKAKKNLHRKISSNTLHGVDSVNDLRAWGFNKDERRQHYLEQMLLGSGSNETELEPASQPVSRPTQLLPYKETEIPVPVLRLKEQQENAEHGKMPAKAISEQYYKEKTIEAHAPASLKRASRGIKEVQTPKLSITNLVEELTPDERNKLLNTLKQLHGDKDHAAVADAHAAELRKLNEHLMDLQGKHKDLQDEKDRLFEQHKKKPSLKREEISHAEPQKLYEQAKDDQGKHNLQAQEEKDRLLEQHKKKSLIPEEALREGRIKGEQALEDLGDALQASDIRGPDDTSEQLSDNSKRESESKSAPQQRGPEDTREQLNDNRRESEPKSVPPQSSSASQPQPPLPPESSDPCSCQIQLLKCQNAMLAHHTKELQCLLAGETKRVQQLMEELDGINTDYTQLHGAYMELESEATGSLRATRLEAQTQPSNPKTNENLLLQELNRTLEQELAQLRAQMKTQNQRMEYFALELERTKCEAGRRLKESMLLEQEVERLGTQLCQLGAENEQLNSNLVDMAANGSKGQGSALQAENEALRQEISLLTSQKLQLSQQTEFLEREQATNCQVVERNKTLQQEITQLTDQIRKLRAGNELLQPTMAELEHTMLDNAELLGLNNCLQQEICQIRNQTHPR